MVPSTVCLASNTRALTPYVRLSHNTPLPCELWNGLIQLPVKHYVTFIIHRQQLCLSVFFTIRKLYCSGRVLPLLNGILSHQIQHDLMSVRLRLLRLSTRLYFYIEPVNWIRHLVATFTPYSYAFKILSRLFAPLIRLRAATVKVLPLVSFQAIVLRTPQLH